MKYSIPRCPNIKTKSTISGLIVEPNDKHCKERSQIWDATHCSQRCLSSKLKFQNRALWNRKPDDGPQHCPKSCMCPPCPHEHQKKQRPLTPQAASHLSTSNAQGNKCMITWAGTPNNQPDLVAGQRFGACPPDGVPMRMMRRCRCRRLGEGGALLLGAWEARPADDFRSSPAAGPRGSSSRSRTQCGATRRAGRHARHSMHQGVSRRQSDVDRDPTTSTSTTHTCAVGTLATDAMQRNRLGMATLVGQCACDRGQSRSSQDTRAHGTDAKFECDPSPGKLHTSMGATVHLGNAGPNKLFLQAVAVRHASAYQARAGPLTQPKGGPPSTGTGIADPTRASDITAELDMLATGGFGPVW